MWSYRSATRVFRKRRQDGVVPSWTAFHVGSWVACTAWMLQSEPAGGRCCGTLLPVVIAQAQVRHEAGMATRMYDCRRWASRGARSGTDFPCPGRPAQTGAAPGRAICLMSLTV